MLATSDYGLRKSHEVLLGNTQFWLIIKDQYGQDLCVCNQYRLTYINHTELPHFHSCIYHAITYDDNID
jgi:hypothetical protein